MFLSTAAVVLSLSVPEPAGAPVADFSMTARCPLEEHPASFSGLSASHLDRSDSDVLVVVSSSVAAPLSGRLVRFQQDLEAEGFDVVVEQMSGGDAEDLRAQIQSHPGLGGAILVGWLPAAWYEMDEWGGPHEEFPLDLFFMDTDGVWSDADGDGMYDSHSGDVGAEIWVGRIDAHAVEFGGEIEMLAGFLDKNHFYRTGAMSVPARAMAFNDDDWAFYDDCGLSSIYSTVDVYNDENQTTAAWYRDRLAHGYEFVHLMSHSSPWGHTFKTTSGYSGTVMAPEIAQINPQTVFVQLFACSNCRWTEPDCLGNWYLFGEDCCQLAIGSTKTGSMLDFEVFYGPIGDGAIPGAAFETWMNQVGIYDEAWHYGCVLLGDPTIRPMGGAAAASIPPSGGTGHEGGRAWVQVSNSTHSDCYPSVAGDAGDLWVAWMTGGTARLDIATRHFDGASWGSVTVVDSDEYWDVQPALALDASGQPWLAWASFEEASYGYDIMIAHGAGFGTVSTLVDGSGYDVDPSLSLAGGKLWLTWQTWRRGEGDIMVRTVDGTFPETILSGPEGSEDFSPVSASDGSGCVHAAWVRSDQEGDRIMWSRGNSSGFSAPVAVTSAGCFARSPSLSFEGGMMRLVWQEGDAAGAGTSIRCMTWDGASWSAPVTIYSTGLETICLPVTGTSPTGGLFTAWQQGRGSAARLWASTWSGSGWSTPALLLDTDGPAWTPALCGGVIAWAGDESGSDWNIWVSLEGGVGIGSPSEPVIEGVALLRNPVRGTAFLSVPAGLADIDVTVVDLAGRVVASASVPVEGGTAGFSCADLPTGAYLLRVSAGGASGTLRMAVIR